MTLLNESKLSYCCQMVIAAILLLAVYPAGIVFAEEYFEGYYMYLGQNPDKQKEQYTEELNGITHDDSKQK